MTPSIVVLAGGPSSERQISLRSGQAVFEALRSLGEPVRLATMAEELPADLDPTRDIIFLTTHGSFGEDGTLQAALDKKGFIYTGADADASRLCFQKTLTRNLADRLGISIPEGVAFAQNLDAESLFATLGPKLVLKPQAQGSSVGLHITRSLPELFMALKTIAMADNPEPYLAEKFIEGRELTCGFLNGRALVPVEIIPQSGIYDYEHKYTTGKTRYDCPAQISPSQLAHVVTTTERLCKAAGVRDFARVDFRLGMGSVLYFLEINTLPGLTATSLLPKSAAPLGYDFPNLCRAMMKGAQIRFANKYAMKLATT